MNPKSHKIKRPSYFTNSHKQSLAKKMIFDHHQAQVPSSCYDLRPIDQNQSNQQDIVYDPKSSSMKEISEISKNSPPQFEKIIYGQMYQVQNQSLFIDCDKSSNSPNYSSKYPENQRSHQVQSNSQSNGNHLKRQNPIPMQEVKMYQNISKIYQKNQENNNSYLNESKVAQPEKIQNSSDFLKSPLFSFKTYELNQNLESSKKKKSSNKKIQIEGLFEQMDIKAPLQQKIQQFSYSVFGSMLGLPSKLTLQSQSPIKIQHCPPLQSIGQNNYNKKINTKYVQTPDFELINQYTELLSYASLIQDMIAVYDKSPLFENSLDFDSEPEEDQMEKILTFRKQSKDSNKNCIDEQDKVKIQQNSMEEEKTEKRFKYLEKMDKNQKLMLTELQKLKIQEASPTEKKKIIQQANFRHSKIYANFYEPIQQLKPFVKKITAQQKKIFVDLKKQLKQIKDIIDFFQKRNAKKNKEHICKICGEQFSSGRQLGGHMSRKHPGKAMDYVFKKELHRIKEIERNRRKYFKLPVSNKDEVKMENNEN